MLNINEIYYSIQGESAFAGRPCVLVRLSGCNLRCIYCDTPYAFKEAFPFTLESVWEKVQSYSCTLVEITGGEPLIQSETPELARGLTERGMTVLVETNGTMNIDALPQSIIRIMDIKCPGSGFADRNDWKNLERLRPGDEVKFVIQDRNDFDWASKVVRKHGLHEKAGVAFSPVSGQLQPQTLAEWILKECLPVRLQLQIHKILWPEKERGR